MFVVKINKKYISPINSIIDAQHYKDIQNLTEVEVINLGIKSNDPNFIITRFVGLKSFSMENQSLTKLPKFENVNIKKMSFGGNKISAIKNDTFVNVVFADFLYLHSNVIHSVENRSFPEVEVIVLNCNNLSTFKSAWFLAPSKLKMIYLRNNRISSLHPHAFRDVENLTYLVLSSNMLKQLPAKVFPFKRLHTLDLGYNKLYELHVSWFGNSDISIHRFIVELNRLTFISENFLRKVSIDSGDFSGNPWQCPCLSLMNRDVNRIIYDSYKNILPLCIYAKSFKNYCIFHVDEELITSFFNGSSIKYKKLQCSSL